MADSEDQTILAELATGVASAYVKNNAVPIGDLPALLRSVHDVLSSLGQPVAVAVAGPEPLKPRMPLKKTVTDEHIVSLEDGKPYQTLKRHLARYGLTPDAYRQKWNLPRDYPMVAPAYARRRTALAKESGLGQKRRATSPAAVSEQEVV